MRITRTRPNHVLIETDISVRAQPLNLTLIPLYKGWRRIKLKIQYSPSGYNQSHHPASFEMLNREYTFIFFWVKIQLIIALGYEASFPHLIQNIHEVYWVLVSLEFVVEFLNCKSNYDFKNYCISREIENRMGIWFHWFNVIKTTASI